MDRSDLTILQRYTDDPRVQLSSLSSELKLSKNAVSERIKRLKKEKQILRSTCFPNYFKLGFSQHIVFIKSSKYYADPGAIAAVKKDLVIEILSLLGRYNLYIKFISRSNHQKQQFIENVIDVLNVEDYEVVNILHYDLVPAKKYRKEKKRLPLPYKPSSANESQAKVDATDLAMLRELCTDSEQSLALIADVLGESPQKIAYRFKRLLRERVILRLYGYTNVFDSGLQLYFIRFHLPKPTESLKLFGSLIADPCIQDISVLDQKQNFFCTLEANSRNELLATVQYLLHISRTVKDLDIDIFQDQIYYNFFPAILLEKV